MGQCPIPMKFWMTFEGQQYAKSCRSDEGLSSTPNHPVALEADGRSPNAMSLISGRILNCRRHLTPLTMRREWFYR
jgi:hypothetical protein